MHLWQWQLAAVFGDIDVYIEVGKSFPFFFFLFFFFSFLPEPDSV